MAANSRLASELVWWHVAFQPLVCCYHWWALAPTTSLRWLLALICWVSILAVS
jgi:hypothetical protein